MSDMAATPVRLDGRDYVILPREEYEQLAGLPAGLVDAKASLTASIARDMRAAREAAGLSQAALAKKIKKSQPMVARVETGDVSVGERYVLAVLKACGLPKDWKPGKEGK